MGWEAWTCTITCSCATYIRILEMLTGLWIFFFFWSRYIKLKDALAQQEHHNYKIRAQDLRKTDLSWFISVIRSSLAPIISVPLPGKHNYTTVLINGRHWLGSQFPPTFGGTPSSHSMLMALSLYKAKSWKQKLSGDRSWRLIVAARVRQPMTIRLLTPPSLGPPSPQEGQ